MKKEAVAPIVPLGCAAAGTFYVLYAAAVYGMQLSRGAVLFFLSGAVGCICFAVLQPLLRQRACFFAVAAGVLIGLYAALYVQSRLMPPKTLADMHKVCTVAAECAGDPVPAGSDFYRVPVQLMACADTDGRQFSAKGSMTLLLPAALIRGSYAGGITRIGKKAAGFNTAWHFLLPQLPEPAACTDICRFYTKGMRLFLHGRCTEDGTAFFARSEHPLFLGWASRLARLRAVFRFRLMRLLYDCQQAGGLLLALLAADKMFLPAECSESFKYAGLSHILALSGMHLSLIAAAAAQSAVIFRNKRQAVLFSCIAVLLFVWFAGSTPSLSRSLGMLVIAVAGRALGVRPPLLSVLCAAVTCHIAVNPADAVRIGFMLSYAACAGIILIGDAVSTLMKGKVPYRLLDSLSASAGAYLFTVPLVAGFAGFIAPAGIAASCIVSPLISVFLLGGLVCIPVAMVFPLTQAVFIPCFNGLYQVILFFSSFFARMPLIAASSAGQKASMTAAVFCMGLLLLKLSRSKNKTGGLSPDAFECR